MGDFAVALIARLKAHAPLTALVGARCHYVEVPQGVALPYVRVSIVTPDQERTLSGPDGLKWARVQIDAYAATALAARQISHAVRAALEPPALVSGVRFQRAMIAESIEFSETVATGSIRRSLTSGEFFHSEQE